MKLIDLLESRKSPVSRHNGENIGYYTSKKAPQPFVLVIPSPNGDKYGVVSLTKDGKAIIKDILTKDVMSRRGYEPMTDADNKLLDAIRRYSIGISYPFTDYPEVFDVQFLSHDDMYKTLLNSFRIDSARMKSHYGDMPEFDDNIQYGDVTIIPTDRMSPASLKLTHAALDDAKSRLGTKGMGGLISGKFRIAKLSAGVGALYLYGSQITTLAMTGLRKHTSGDSIIHEMGHKWEDVSGLENVIVDKWNEVVKAGNSHTSRPVLKVGDVIVLPTPADRRYNGIEFEIVQVNHDNLKIHYIDKKGQDAQAKAPWDMFTPDRAKHSDGRSIMTSGGNAWFPSHYATTDHHEFFAENFVRYIAGTASTEVTEWMDSLPKP